MDNGRYLRNTNPQADYSDSGEANYTRDYGAGQDYTYSSAREYQAEGRAASEIGKLWAAIERSIKAIRGNGSATGAMHKQAA